MIEIWEPKWKTREVLIAKNKIKKGKNLLVFTKSPSLKGRVFSFDGQSVKDACDTQKIGKGYQIDCYRVPFGMLKEEEDLCYDTEVKQIMRVAERTEEIGQMVLEELRY